MRNQHIGGAGLRQLGLQPLDRFDIQVVRRLVQQHDLGIKRQRSGDLERPLAPVGQFGGLQVGHVGEPHVGQQLHRPRVEVVDRRDRAPETVGMAVLGLQRDAHVLQHRHVGEGGRDLERPHQAEPGDIRGRHRGDVAAVIGDRAPRRLQELGQQVEAGRLSGPVGADEGMNRAALDREVDVVDGDKALELLRQARGPQHGAHAGDRGMARQENSDFTFRPPPKGQKAYPRVC